MTGVQTCALPISALADLVKNDGKFGMRLAAAVLAAAGNLSKVDENSLMVPTIEKLVTEGGPDTRRVLVNAVMQGTSATPVAGPMLEKIMTDPDPMVVLTALQARAKDMDRRRAAARNLRHAIAGPSAS